MEQTIQNTIDGAQLLHCFDFLAVAYVGMEKNNKIRTFMTLGREELGAEWLSNRGIKEKFDENHLKFFGSVFFNDESPNSMLKLFSEDRIKSFAVEIAKELAGIKTSKEAGTYAAIEKLMLKEFEEGTALDNPVLNMLHAIPYHESYNASEQSTTEAETVEAQEQTQEEKPQPVEKEPEALPVKQPIPVEAKPLPPVTVEKEKVQLSLDLPLGRIVEEAVARVMQENDYTGQIKSMVSDALKAVTVIQVSVPGRPVVTMGKRVHAQFDEALEACQMDGNAFFSGPAGTGKTSLAENVAEALSLPFAFISCTSGMSESHLVGRMNAHGDYIESDFVQIYENGGVFLFDEIDAGDANTLLIINSALANGKLSVKNRAAKPFALRHPDCIIICAANTWGFGSNEYAGRNILDAAFLDRFTLSRVYVDYDKALEKEISNECPEIAKMVQKIRKNCAAARIRRVISTRFVIAATKRRKTGMTLVDIAKRFFTGWTNEERDKALQGVNLSEKTEKEAATPGEQ